MLSTGSGKKEEHTQDPLQTQTTENADENDRISVGLVENVEDDGWGLVDSTVIASSLMKQQKELDETGVLILSGEDAKTSSEESPAALGKKSETSNTKKEQETPGAPVSTLPDLNDVPTEIPNEHDIPSDLETLPDIPLDDTSIRGRVVPADDRSQAPSEGIRALQEELEMADTLFGLRAHQSKEKEEKANSSESHGIHNKINQLLQQPHVLVLALSFLAVSMFGLYERSMWQASMKELRTELESQRQLEAQRQTEMASLVEEFQQALKDQEKIKLAATPPEPKQDTRPPSKKKRQRPGEYPKFPHFLFDDTVGDESYQFDHCWTEAEARLGDCAKHAKNAFKSRLQTMGRSLWHVQEQVVDKASDLGKLVKGAAERVVSEAERWSENSSTSSSSSSSSFSNGNTHNKATEKNETTLQESKTSFRTMASTLVSSVALASLAAVVADKASSYIAGLGEERD